jgi:hypothetical protein
MGHKTALNLYISCLRALVLVMSPADREALLGDLLEKYHANVKQLGDRPAFLALRREVMASICPFLWWRIGIAIKTPRESRLRTRIVISALLISWAAQQSGLETGSDWQGARRGSRETLPSVRSVPAIGGAERVVPGLGVTEVRLNGEDRSPNNMLLVPILPPSIDVDIPGDWLRRNEAAEPSVEAIPVTANTEMPADPPQPNDGVDYMLKEAEGELGEILRESKRFKLSDLTVRQIFLLLGPGDDRVTFYKGALGEYLCFEGTPVIFHSDGSFSRVRGPVAKQVEMSYQWWAGVRRLHYPALAGWDTLPWELKNPQQFSDLPFQRHYPGEQGPAVTLAIER